MPQRVKDRYDQQKMAHQRVESVMKTISKICYTNYTTWKVLWLV